MNDKNCKQLDANWEHHGRMCNERSKHNFICTRTEGHTGKHHAHGIDRECYEVW